MRHSRHITRGPRWAALRLEALRHDGWRCRACGRPGRLEVDHIKPVREAPELAYALENLQSLCARCHTEKTNAETGRVARSPEQKRWAQAVKSLCHHHEKR
ncbi:MAG: HNH endonuclease signature motif containing protein [Pseudomonadota bacterium]